MRAIDMTDEERVPITAVNVPHFYFNGFQLSLGSSDVTCILMINNEPSVSMSMSYTTAKSLQESLSQLVETLESVTGHTIMTSKVVGDRMKANLEKKQAENG